MSHRICTLLMPLLLALLVGSVAPADAASGTARGAGACKDATTVPSSSNTSRIRAATLCLVNRERTERGRSKLSRDRKLERVASKYTSLMVREEFFDHVSPGGGTLSSRISRSSYLNGSLERWSVGENIAWGTGRLATPSAVVDGWMKSPGHRRNILDRRFREAGFGVVAGGPAATVHGDAATYTNVFGQRVER